MFIVSINAWLLVRVTRVKAAIVAVSTASMFVIMGSPMFVVSVAITLTVLVWDPRASIRTRVAMVLATLVISVAFLVMFGGTALSTLETRVGNIGATDSTGQLERRSENVRAVTPWIALVNTMGRWPIFGVGFGGKEVVFDTSVIPASTSKEAIGGNAVTQVGMYLGVLGGTWFIWLLFEAGLANWSAAAWPDAGNGVPVFYADGRAGFLPVLGNILRFYGARWRLRIPTPLAMPSVHGAGCPHVPALDHDCDLNLTLRSPAPARAVAGYMRAQGPPWTYPEPPREYRRLRWLSQAAIA